MRNNNNKVLIIRLDACWTMLYFGSFASLFSYAMLLLFSEDDPKITTKQTKTEEKEENFGGRKSECGSCG